MNVIGVLKSITIAAFLMLALLAIAANIKLPQNYGLFVVQSGSMEPAIPVASVVLTKPTSDFSAPLPMPRFLKGDVVTFSSGSSLVSHRVIETVNKDGQFFYRTKGDANQEADRTLVAEKDTIGKVKLTVPYLGRFVNFAKAPLGYFLMILVPSLYVIISEILIIVVELRRSRTKIPAAGLTLPVTLLFVGSLYFVGGTAAFFSDMAISSSNAFQTADSFANEPYADAVTSVSGTFGHCCNANDLSSDPSVAKPLVSGAPDGQFIQISDNSSVTFKFVDNRALPTGDTDSDIRIYVIDALFPAEASIEVSKDGTTWFSLGNHFDTADVDLNIESTGLSEVNYVRLNDLTSLGDIYPTLGFDLDAIEALNSAPD